MKKGLVLFCLVLLAGPVHANVDDLSKAVSEGKVNFDFRYRYEFVDQDGIDEEAGASTLRSRLTFVSGAVNGWTAGVEADYTAVIGSERYNSTENGMVEYPVVADPEGFDLNQSYLRYKNDDLTFTGGRQRIVHAGQRFVGGVAWRQNEQTYDAARIQFKPSKSISLDYSYVWNVNRIFGPNDGAQPADWRGDSHFLIANWTVEEGHKLEAFAYLLDFDNDNGVPNSTATYGVGYTGKFGPIGVNASYATQSDHGDSPLDYDADFYSIGVNAKVSKVTLNAGMEVLGSDDGLVGFKTPLATLHKFQGWADKFLGTPAAGIEDTYAGVAGSIGKVKVALTYHDFQSDEGSIDYGDEINVVATMPIKKGTTVQLKYADYSADEFATDTTKIWLSFMLKF